jgi:hypothetical protein
MECRLRTASATTPGSMFRLSSTCRKKVMGIQLEFVDRAFYEQMVSMTHVQQLCAGGGVETTGRTRASSS